MSMKKPVWFILSCLIVAILTLASCGTASTTQTTTPTEVKGTVTLPTTSTTTPKTTTTTTTTKPTSSDVPKYGGTLTITWNADVINFDNCYYLSTGTLRLTNEELFQGDWARGPAGTNEVSWRIVSFPGVERYSNKGLAESWEITGTANDTLVLHIRKGVNWQNKAPTNGRELTSDDVIFSINRCWTNPSSIMGNSYPAPQSMSAPDKYTAILKYRSLSELSKSLVQVCDMNEMWPKDAVVAKNNDMRDWRSSIGTGAYMLTDYVKGSSATLVRNPNYWDKDPIGPGKGNQLPYPDGVKILIIPDMSTRLAAMRTAKSDQDVVPWDMAATLRKSNPELVWTKSYSVNPYDLYMRVDNTSFPWSNLKVRQAMSMAVDYQAIANTYYGGDAAWYHYPGPAYDEAKDYKTPFNELPKAIQDIYTYQPDKAKQMLADAGYAKGFDVKITCQAIDSDLMSIYKDYWAKIGVNMIVDVKEYAVYQSIRAGGKAEQGIYALTSMQVAFDMVEVNPTHPYNYSKVNDKKCQDAYEQLWANYMDWNKRCQIYKDISQYILENVWTIPCPQPSWYTMWQPWLKGYHGEMSVGNTSQYNWAKWVWIDQDLKEQMTGRR
jgi:peptide/nickel transport system substrate-binding protein